MYSKGEKSVDSLVLSRPQPADQPPGKRRTDLELDSCRKTPKLLKTPQRGSFRDNTKRASVGELMKRSRSIGDIAQI